MTGEVRGRETHLYDDLLHYAALLAAVFLNDFSQLALGQENNIPP